ncbi:MAG TPA: MmcQ/YjbR family DNA-binding protein [Clostridia bacterium]|nr:MmcQ/YjbR family DNA-binding protein [Clostridia bacterium]
MTIETVRQHCLSFPHATENLQWGDHLCFKVGGKLFAIGSLDGVGQVLSFKCSPEKFAELPETEGIVPAPYMARAHWVALERFDVLRDQELRELLAEAYRIIFEKLPKKVRAELEGAGAKRAAKKTSRNAPKKSAKKKMAANSARSRA